MRLVPILLAILLALPLTAQEESLPKSSTTVKYYDAAVPQELHGRITSFFKLLINNEIEQGFKNILKDSPLARKESELKNLIEQTERANEVYGALKGFEAVDAEVASSSLIKCRYMGLYSRYPLRWIFTFYKSPEQGWIITNIKFDDQSDYFFRRD